MVHEQYGDVPVYYRETQIIDYIQRRVCFGFHVFTIDTVSYFYCYLLLLYYTTLLLMSFLLAQRLSFYNFVCYALVSSIAVEVWSMRTGPALNGRIDLSI